MGGRNSKNKVSVHSQVDSNQVLDFFCGIVYYEMPDKSKQEKMIYCQYTKRNGWVETPHVVFSREFEKAYEEKKKLVEIFLDERVIEEIKANPEETILLVGRMKGILLDDEEEMEATQMNMSKLIVATRERNTGMMPSRARVELLEQIYNRDRVNIKFA